MFKMRWVASGYAKDLTSQKGGHLLDDINITFILRKGDQEQGAPGFSLRELCSNSNTMLTLVTGGTGYIGKNLIPVLLKLGTVRVLCRNIDNNELISLFGTNPAFSVCKGDMVNIDSLREAIKDVDIVHNM